MKKFLSLLLCFCLIFNVFLGCFNVFAAGEECEISVDKITAIPGDDVIVNLNIKNNPGIMAMTISITYDASVLEYQRYGYGDVFTDYTVANHTSRNLIRLVISQKKDFYYDGVVASFYFKVKDTADADLHKITVEYSSGDFCNNDLVRLMPTIIPGGVDVMFTGSNCLHKKFTEWERILEPSCEDEGAYSRTCKKCGHFESKPISPVGHEFSPNWVVDIPATKEEAGTMSRHCIRCDKVTDETNFFLEDVEDSDIDNKYDGDVPENDVVSDIITEQHPEIDFDNLDSTNSTTSSNKNESNSDNSPSSSDSATTSENSSANNPSDTTSSVKPDKTENSSEQKDNSSVGKNESIDSSSKDIETNNQNDDTNSSTANSSDNKSDNNIDSSSKKENSDKTNKVEASTQSTSSNKNNSDSKDNNKKPEPQTDKEKTEEKIENFFEIITPDDDNAEKAQSVAQILREKIPNFDTYYKYTKIAMILIYILLLI